MSREVRAPSANELRVAESMVKTGIYTVNEVRAILQLPPLQHGEEIARL